jgi:hypothetical protein
MPKPVLVHKRQGVFTCMLTSLWHVGSCHNEWDSCLLQIHSQLLDGLPTPLCLFVWLVFKRDPRKTHIMLYSTKLHGVMLQRIVALRFTAVLAHN